MAVFSKLW